VADQNRRVGCGCLPLVALLIAGSLIVGGLDRTGTGWGRVVASTALVVLAAVIVVGAVVQRRRQETAGSEDGMATPTGPSRPKPSLSAPPAPRSMSEQRAKELRSGPRDLVTQADDPETDRLREHLVEAVADLADATENMVSGGPQGRAKRLTSEEMIARAKKRIAEFGKDRQT
jgi:hypothetical protein